MSERPKSIQQGYRYPLDPSPEQREFLGSCAGASRYWFNQGLALVKQRLDQRKAGDRDVYVPWSYKALCSVFAPLKDEICPWRTEVVVGSQQAGLEALGKALQNFSRARKSGRRVGFPRFRAKSRCPEAIIFQRPRITDMRHVTLDRRLGPIRTRESMRKLTRLLERDPNARILRSTVSRRGERWWISFTIERSPKRRRARRPRSCVGVDLGISALATLSTGERVGNRRPLAQAQRRLRREERKLDRQRRANNPDNYMADGRAKPGATSWTRSRRMLATEVRIRRLHERCANLRRHSAHELTRQLTDGHGVIGVESLNVSGMLQNRRLARQIADVGWGEIARQLAYKSSWADTLLVSADTFYPSSKTCSGCGAVKAKLSLAERVFRCAECGLVLDRDENAALNLAEVARRCALADGVSHPYVARVGRETLNARGGRVSPRSSSLRQRGHALRSAKTQRTPSSSSHPAPAMRRSPLDPCEITPLSGGVVGIPV